MRKWINMMLREKLNMSLKLKVVNTLLLMSIAFFSTNVYSKAVDNLTCYSTVFAPFVLEQEGQVKGIDVDVIKEVGRRLGINVEFKLMPWKRLENFIKSGEIDCVAAYFQTPERMKYMDFTHIPLHMTAYTLFARKEDARNYSSLEDLKTWKIGVNRGFKTTPEFEEALYNGWVEKYEVTNDMQSFSMLEKGRLTAVLTNYHVGLYNIRELGLKDIVPIFPSIRTAPAYFVLSKKKNLGYLVQKFDEALFEVLKDGTYKKIFDTYLK